eukprot:2411158-Rhodomonas_salina.1
MSGPYLILIWRMVIPEFDLLRYGCLSPYAPAMHCPVQTKDLASSAPLYAMSGTDLVVSFAIFHAMLGTDASTFLRARYAMSGTDIAIFLRARYAILSVSPSVYAIPTRCQGLT